MNNEEAQAQILSLSEKIHHLNHQYYMNDVSEVTDQEFDALLAQLIELENKYPEFKRIDSPSQRVGGSINKEFKTIPHQYPMLSLGNTYTNEELIDFDNRIKKALNEPFEYICELKFDGVALSVRYQNNTLALATTRGDGEKGDDITSNVKTIRTIPLRIQLTTSFDFEVRGEVFFPLKEFNRVNAEREELGEATLANPRNAASGTIKMQDSSIVASRKLDCYIYGLLGENLPVETHYDALKWLEKHQFNVSDSYQKCSSIEEVMEYIEVWRTKRYSLPLDTDGIVIKVNSYRQQQLLGTTAKSPRWAIAFKYASENVATKLEQVTYQVGRTGAITPVANLSPVQLAGTVVKRASLHNANEIERLDVREGDIVFVEKGGEIIPKITGVDLSKRPEGTLPLQYITHCPECNTPLIRKESEANHYCPNTAGCPPQLKGKIEHFISRKAMNIDSLGSETIDQLFSLGLIKDVSDLYNLTYDQLVDLDRFGKKSTEKLLENIKKSTEVPFSNLLFAIGIRYVGNTVAEKLASYFSSMEALSNATLEQLIQVPEIGERIAQSVVEFFESEHNKLLIEKLRSHGLKMESDESLIPMLSNKLDGKSFVVSGVFTHYSRDGITETIKQHGGKILSGISAKLNYLVAGENMGPSKLEKAQKLGISIISEEEFIQMLE